MSYIVSKYTIGWLFTVYKINEDGKKRADLSQTVLLLLSTSEAYEHKDKSMITIEDDAMRCILPKNLALKQHVYCNNQV